MHQHYDIKFEKNIHSLAFMKKLIPVLSFGGGAFFGAGFASLAFFFLLSFPRPHLIAEKKISVNRKADTN